VQLFHTLVINELKAINIQLNLLIGYIRYSDTLTRMYAIVAFRNDFRPTMNITINI